MMLLPSHPRAPSLSLAVRLGEKVPSDRSHMTRDVTGVSRSLSPEARNAIGLSEILRYLIKIFFVRVSDKNCYGDFLSTNCCVGRVGGNLRATLSKCVSESLLRPHLSLAIPFKTLKNQILENQPSLLSQLFRAFENLPVYLGAKCCGGMRVCSGFSSKGLEGIPGIAKQAALEANRCCAGGQSLPRWPPRTRHGTGRSPGMANW